MVVEFLKSFFVPLVAAFLGAYFAFRYQDVLYKKQKREEDIENITKEYLKIFKQTNQLATILVQFCNEILTDEIVLAMPFDYRFADYVEDANLTCVALKDADLYVRIQESNGGYDYALILIEKYNHAIEIKNEFIIFNFLGAILQKTLEVVERNQKLMSDMFSFVASKYKMKKYIKMTVPDIDKEEIYKKIDRIKRKISQLQHDSRDECNK